MNNDTVEIILKSGKFPHPFHRRKLVETHISFVILGTSFAYKFKKEIRYSFLDFSTLEKRKYFCERELMLNNRLTKGMYLKVVPVRLDMNEIWVDGQQGEIIDYAIKMKRMQDARQMHVMLSKNQVNAKHIKSLAELIRNFHQRTIRVDRSFDKFQYAEQFNDILSIKGIAERTLENEYVQMIEKAARFSDEFLRSHQILFIERIEKKYIRDCHGDLHSRNIFLYTKPVIFDCIEFNDELRQIDILDEIAFFCMDLEAHGFIQFSKIFTEKYFENAENEFGRKEQMLFTYYKAYRANVRAKVNALRSKTSEGSAFEKNVAEIKKYLQLMNAYLKELA